MRTKKKTAIYLRVSDEGETQSLNEQEPIVREDLESIGQRENVEFEIVHVLKEDAGQKGWSDKRSEFNTLKGLITQKKVEVVAVKELSRLFRNTKLALEFLELLVEYNVEIRVRGARIPIETSSGRSQYLISAVFHDMETSQNSERSRASIRSLAKKGVIHGRSILKGYQKIAKGVWKIDEKEALEIKFLFRKFNEVMSYKRTIEELEERGIKTKKNKKYSHSTLKNNLTNIFYTGVVKYKDEFEVQNPSLTIIKKNLFETTQRNIKLLEESYKSRNNIAKKKRNAYLLTGLLKTPSGNSFSGKSAWGRNKKYERYHCTKEGFSIDAPMVEDIVKKSLQEIKEKKDLKQQAKKVKRSIHSEETLLRSSIENNKKRLLEIRKSRQAILEKVIKYEGLDHVIELVNGELENLKSDEVKINETIVSVEKQLLSLQSVESEVMDQVKVIDDEIDEILFKSDKVRLRSTLRKLLSEIIVDVNAGTLEIFWKIENNGIDFQLKNCFPVSVFDKKKAMLDRLLGSTPDIIETTPIYQLYVCGDKTTKEVAKELKVSRTTILEYLKKYRIPRRKTGKNKNGKRAVVFGKTSKNWKLKDNKYEQEIIREIVRLREVKKRSYHDIADSLNGAKARTKTGKGKWWARTVCEIYKRYKLETESISNKQ